MKLSKALRYTKHFTLALSLAAILGGTTTLRADDEDRNNQFDFALLGDVPYAPTSGGPPNKVQTYPSPEYNAVIADINNHRRVAFSVHVGDIKAGDTWCVGGNSKDPSGAANVYLNNFTLFNSYRNGVVYLPGDNEWTDCHRTNNGAYNPTERLAYLRTTFYSTNQSLGQATITLTRQSSDPAYALYKENVRWRYGNILFVGINQPGSNNNHKRNTGASIPAPTDDNEAEYTARNAANIAWINKAFADAMADTSTRAVVILQQANVFERFLELNQGYLRSGYESFVSALRKGTVAFGKPVVLVGGDTHTIRIDKPLTSLATASGALVGYPSHSSAAGSGVVTPTTLFDTATGTTSACVVPIPITCVTPGRVQNFTRVEVFGSPDTHWVRGVVDPFDPNVFSFAMQTIAGNGHGRDGRAGDDREDEQ